MKKKIFIQLLLVAIIGINASVSCFATPTPVLIEKCRDIAKTNKVNQETILVCNQAIAENPNNTDGYYWRGLAYTL